MQSLEAFTRYLAQAHGCRSIVELELGDPTPSVARRLDLDRTGSGAAATPTASLRASDLAQALLACRLGGTERPVEGERLRLLRGTLASAAAGVVVLAPDARARPSALERARRALEALRLSPTFVGRVRDPVTDRETVAAVLGGARASHAESPPPDFRVVAIIPTHDEEDVIEQTLRDVLAQGLEPYVVDNGSTDATVQRALPFLGRGLLGLERFPPDGAARTYDLRALLARVEEIAAGLARASWVVLHDADERRRSPWPGVGLREALWRVDRSGYSCVDHVTLNFWPTGEGFDPAGPDLEQQLLHFEFSDHPGHFHQRRAWKQLGHRVSLAPSAGHDVDFPGRRVYPYKFLLKHYPIRSQAHGERKLRDRRGRWNAEERAAGWHRQYDGLTPGGLVRDGSTLRRFDPATFHEEFLVERLSAAGVFEEPPPWATPPRW